VRLLPQLDERYNPMPCVAACGVESGLAIALRAAGYDVWQA
jgi:hypothetical protein